MAKYSYPAIFTKEIDGGFSVRFPDIKNCFTQGNDMTEALEMAGDALCLTLYTMETDGDPIPSSSAIESVKLSENEVSSYIYCDTLTYKKFFEKRSVKKTLTIPSWLNELAEAQHINFSSVLKEALMEKLNVN